MSKDQESQADLSAMQRVKEGDLGAFDDLVRKYQRALMNFFGGLGVYTDVDDLVQDTFMRIYRRREQYRPTAKFTTYLYTVARSVWIDWTRRQVRRTDGLTALATEMAIREEAPKQVPERALAAAEAVDMLPEKLRLVIVLSIFQGLKYQEIADVLEIPVGTVKSRMSNAVKTLKEIMDARRARES